MHLNDHSNLLQRQADLLPDIAQLKLYYYVVSFISDLSQPRDSMLHSLQAGRTPEHYDFLKTSIKSSTK